MTDPASFDVLVHGDGIVGRAAALALAGIGLEVALHRRGDGARAADVRAYALNAGSVGLLDRLGAWPLVPADARTPVHAMDVRGDGSGAIAFSAYEQSVRELAVVVDAGALEAALDARIADPASGVSPAGHEAAAQLVVHAEGRDAEAALPPEVVGVRRAYGQRAIAARLVAERPHANLARQWFAGGEVLALLPFDRPEAGRSYALVWSLPEARAEALLDAPAAEFEQALQAATKGGAGPLAVASTRAAWPLYARRATRVCAAGSVLVGDAAHVVHPLAGQGLNLGLGDVAALAATLAAREPWRGVADERLLRRYVRQRAGAVAAMLRTTDGLQRLFAHDAAWARQVRNNGLTLVNRLRPVKRWLADRALDRHTP